MTLWVFGYGSLLWNPGFEVAEIRHARLYGWARSFCMSSIHHRGTVEKPGLVLALDAQSGSFCDGLALRAAPGTEEQTLDYLRERELVTSAYQERRVTVSCKEGALSGVATYVIDPKHNQYVGSLTLEHQARIIAKAVGLRGPNTEYLYNTAQHLANLGIPDTDLNWLVGRTRVLCG